MNSRRCLSATALTVFFLCGAAEAMEVPKWERAGWSGGGCYSSAAWHPAVPGRVYLSSDVAGVWQSDDAARTWKSINEGLGSLGVAFVEAPPTPEGPPVAGTEDGLYVRRGEIWKRLDSPADPLRFVRPRQYRSAVFHPARPNVVAAGDASGRVALFDLSSGSRTALANPFSKKDEITVLGYDPEGRLWAGGTSGMAVWNESPAGGTWKRETAIQGEVTDWARNGKKMWVAAGGKIYTRDHSEERWRKLAAAPRGGFFRVAADLREPSRILAAWNDGWKTGLVSSEGPAWSKTASQKSFDQEGNPTRLWVSAFARTSGFAADPHSPGRILRTDWWGVWLSEDGGVRWSETDRGAQNTVVSDLLAAPDGSLFAATMDNGLLVSRDGGNSYRCVFPVASGERQLHGHVWRVLQLTSGRIFATSSPWDADVNQVVLSDDGGLTYRIVRAGLPPKRPKKNTVWDAGYARAVAEDPFTPGTVYLGIDGDGAGLYVSTDGGDTWARSGGQPGSLRIYNALSCDPVHRGRIYWGATGPQGGIYRSDDGGLSWKKAWSAMRDVYETAVDRQGRLFAAGRDRKGPAVYRSDDGGLRWKRVYGAEGEGRAHALLILPDRSIVAGISHDFRRAGAQLWHMDADGRNRRMISEGLPESEGFAALAWDDRTGRLFAGRTGDGIYRLQMPRVKTSLNPQDH